MKKTGIIPQHLIDRERADIVVCGPEGSGTRALTVNLDRLCAPHFISVRHLSMPHGDWWWEAKDIEGEIPVVIVRRPDYSTIAASRQGCTWSPEEAMTEWPRAIERLSLLPSALWVSYEALMMHARVQLRNLCIRLGIPFDEELLDRGDEWWPWRDENAKYEVSL